MARPRIHPEGTTSTERSRAMRELRRSGMRRVMLLLPSVNLDAIRRDGESDADAVERVVREAAS